MNYNDIELTLLTEKQILGTKQLNVFKKYGTVLAISDLVILTGGFHRNSHTAPDDNTLKGRTGRIFTQTSDGYGDIYNVNANGTRGVTYPYQRNTAICPVLLSASAFYQTYPNRVSGYNQTEEVEYGEYPQYAPDKSIQKILESEYQNRNLQTTGKKYTFDKTEITNYPQTFQAITYDEYEYSGKKYIRVKIINPTDLSIYLEYSSTNFILSNGQTYKLGDHVWIEVSPIKWLIDDKNQILISKIGLLSGIRFNPPDKEYNGDFQTTEMKEYLDKYMSKEIIPSKLPSYIKTEVQEKPKSQREKILDEILICIESLPDKEIIIKKLNEIITEYNNKLDKIKKEQEKNKSIINLTLDTKESITNNLEIRLGMILDNLKNNLDKKSEHLKINEHLDKYISIFEKENNQAELKEEIDTPQTKTEELSKDLKTIVTYCLPFLKEEDNLKIKTDILETLYQEKNKISEYLKIGDIFSTKKREPVNLEYTNEDEFTKLIRKKIHPVLETLSEKVNKRDLELEIKTAINGIINNIYENSKNNVISFHLKEISEETKKISYLLSKMNDNNRKKYKLKLTKILTTNIDYNKETNEIFKEVNNMLLSLYKLSQEIESHIKEIQEIDDSYITPINNVNKTSIRTKQI